MKYVDVHSHWSDERISDQSREAMLKSALEKNIDFFLQGGVDPDEWHMQLALKQLHPAHFGNCFGLHPYYVAEIHQQYEGDLADTFRHLEKSLDELAHVLPKAMALGEAGLDFRPHIMKDSQSIQVEMFENQIELANAYQLPMVLHVVQAHEKAIQVLDLWGVPARKGFVHAFSGSYETAKKYIEKGFLISVGGAVTYEKNRKLRDCVEKLPPDYLLIESDSPDQAPRGWSGLNEPTSILKVAAEIGLIKRIDPFEVLEMNTSNFKRLFRL